MKLYRSIELDELIAVWKTGKIFPKFFPGCEDSDCPTGWWSFWFPYPVKCKDTTAVIEAEWDGQFFESEMTWCQDETPFSYDPYQASKWETYSLPEICINRPVTAIKVTIEKIFVPKKRDLTFFRDMEDEEAERFLEWCHSHARKMFLASDCPYCPIQDFGPLYKEYRSLGASERLLQFLTRDNGNKIVRTNDGQIRWVNL